jgi:hypothetical protein
MTTELPAPESVLHIVKCGCGTKCQTGRCSCRRAGLNCTYICSCADDDELCDNVEQLAIESDDTDDEEHDDLEL